MANKYGERFGVDLGGGRVIWFFELERARAFSAGRYPVVHGTLHNDEGCTPWIETGKPITD